MGHVLSNIGVTESERIELSRRGKRLEYLTIGWNSLEAIVSIVAGAIAGSIALVGFGLDSVIETSSGAILLWRLGQEHDVLRREQAERRALNLVGLSFVALAIYVLVDSAKALLTREAPGTSAAGIVIAALSLIVMPLLARAKRAVARGLSSDAMHADSRQTDICAYLSAILLVGLVLNALLGWWWADPVAGLAMVPLISWEGVKALRGEKCCDDCH